MIKKVIDFYRVSGEKTAGKNTPKSLKCSTLLVASFGYGMQKQRMPSE